VSSREQSHPENTSGHKGQSHGSTDRMHQTEPAEESGPPSGHIVDVSVIEPATQNDTSIDVMTRTDTSYSKWAAGLSSGSTEPAVDGLIDPGEQVNEKEGQGGHRAIGCMLASASPSCVPSPGSFVPSSGSHVTLVGSRDSSQPHTLHKEVGVSATTVVSSSSHHNRV